MPSHKKSHRGNKSNAMPNFRSSDFLLQHMQDTLDFYDANVVDPDGGFRQNFYDDGRTFDDASKHLVSSCRLVFNYCLAYKLFGSSRYRELLAHGADYLRSAHWQPARGGYVWTISADGTDETNHCYGLAFVVLAFSALLSRGDKAAENDLQNAWSIMEERFWQPDIGLYADECSADWSTLSDYRGQNANMHACEAAIFAYEATGEDKFIERACELAATVVVTQAGKADGLIWEHFKSDLSLDWDYNKDDPANLYRPWGFQPGHQTEWTKLLLLLHRHRPADWMQARAAELFDRAVDTAWDDEHGGLFYGFAPDGLICDDDKYFWVQAETMAAAALLAVATGRERYWDWYERIWGYCWQHFVDHEHRAWFRVLSSTNAKLSNKKSIAGAKCDYHNLSACATALECV